MDDLYQSYCAQCKATKDNCLFTPGALKLKRKVCRKCCALNNKTTPRNQMKGPPVHRSFADGY